MNQILPQLKSSSDNIPGVSRSIKLRLHMDNAKTNEKLIELHIERLPQPAYSPDICPNDFFLYSYVKNKLKGHRFETRDDLIKAVIEIIEKIDKSIWISVFDKWIEKLKKVIESNGSYAT